MIRKFEAKDIERVMEIWLEANIDAHDFISKDYWRSQFQSVQDQILNADIYIYELDNEIKGFAGMTGNYLAGIFVDKKCRSAGIGKNLLNYIKKNYPAFSLNVYRKNRRAIEFYLREGMSVASEEVDDNTMEADYKMIWKQKKG